MAENNIIKTPDMGAVAAKDFVDQFGYSIKKLQEALGITRPQPMPKGNTIQTYKFELNKPKNDDGDIDPASIGEGEDIPLTHVSRTPDREFTVGFRKYRKATTMEEVQRVGYELAVTQTDNEVRKAIQKDIRKDFFSFLGTAPTDLGTVSGLQEAFGKSWGKLGDIFDDEEIGTIVFINPIDAGDYLGNAVIQNGQAVGFGMTLLNGFTNVTPVINNSVPQGEFYATVNDNINLQYIDVHGEVAKMFQGKSVTTDETGLIALVHDDNTTNLTSQSTIYTGLNLFAEVTDGVLKGKLKKK